MTVQNSSFAGKTVLITGANGGMGRCLVEKFYEQGANVICCLRTSSKDFEDFIKALSSDYKSIRAIYFDLADEQQTKEVINRLIGEKITLDVLVNNAAIAGGSPVEMTSLKSLRNIFEINFFSQIALTSRLLRLIKKSDQGRVINIGSVVGLFGDRGTISYGSSKSAMMYATKVMANEFAAYNITVNSVAPGVVSAGMSSQMDQKNRDDMTNSTFMKKESMPEDVANAVLFLASKESGLITGQTLRVDGGMKF
jgi:3-oxoacyl-[acyl-carrier protein] reductase